jgi:CelD/BcsL family acetyltransferase involved in cellulose biosynthesis
MHVDVVTNHKELTGLKADWERVYDGDPEAHFFMSWDWLMKRMEIEHTCWFVLVARGGPGGPPVGFFPMRMLIRMRAGTAFWNDIEMAGKPSSDFSGFLCLPQFEGRAIPAFAKHLLSMNWRSIWLNYFRASRKRTRLFLRFFPDRQFDLADIGGVNEGDTVDNTICPFAALPESWDAYLNGLSSNTRQKLRRFLRRVEESDDYRITHADEASVESDLDALIAMWGDKWGASKNEEARRIQQTIQLVTLDCFKDGNLFMPVLWQGDRRVGALICFTDKRHDNLLFYVAGRDESFNDLPGGLVLHAHAIRHAIENGFKTYDFLRGNEPYKYSFATGEYRAINIRIVTKNGHNLGGRIDPMSVPMALSAAKELAKKNMAGPAEIGYRQILQVDPNNTEAMAACRRLTEARVRAT